MEAVPSSETSVNFLPLNLCSAFWYILLDWDFIIIIIIIIWALWWFAKQ
jgi:hypothetical protein